MIKGVIFDMDGVILDSMKIWENLAEDYLISKNREPKNDLREHIFSMSMEESAEYLKDEYQLECTTDEVLEAFKDMVKSYYFDAVPLKGRISDVLKFLKDKNLPMVVATSSPYEHAISALERNDVLKYFKEVLTTGELGESKRSPLIFFKSAEILGTKPSETLVIDDSLYAVKTARNNGFCTVGVYEEFNITDEREMIQNTKAYLKDIGDLINCWDKINGKMKAALTIAGSDSSGGAGVQADIKTMMANGVYAMSAITAMTAQNTVGVKSIMNATPEFLADELDAVFEDIYPDAVKIGMVSVKALIKVIAKKLKEYKAENIVIDPVMVATSGAKLISDDALESLKNELLPLADILTPNIPEAEILTGLVIKSKQEMVEAAKLISRKYSCAVLCKGGHNVNDANDLLYYNDTHMWFDGRRIDNPNTHGTGCTLSSAIASNLAKGYELSYAVQRAKDYISDALADMLDLGKGSGPMNHGFGIINKYSEEHK